VPVGAQPASCAKPRARHIENASYIAITDASRAFGQRLIGVASICLPQSSKTLELAATEAPSQVRSVASRPFGP
jgi:hypothetical protein